MLKKYFSAVLTLFSAAAIGVYLYKNPEIFGQIARIDVLRAAGIFVLLAASLYVNGLFFKILTAPFGIKLKEHFLLSLSTSFFNLITFFSGGMAARAVYMKKKYGFAYSSFLASLTGNYVIIWLADSVLALAAFAVVYARYGIFNAWLVAIFFGIFAIGLAPVLFPHFRFSRENFLTAKINKVIEGWHLILRHKNIIPKLALGAFSNIALMALANKLAFSAIGTDISLSKAFCVTVISTLSMFTLNITPGSLGVTEALYMIAGKIIGAPYESSLAAALVIRAANTLLLAVGGPIANFLLARKLSPPP